MSATQTPPRPSRSLAEWQGVAAILALKEDRRLRRLEMLKGMGAIPTAATETQTQRN